MSTGEEDLLKEVATQARPRPPSPFLQPPATRLVILDFDSYRSRVKAMEETAGHDVSELIRLRKRLKESDEALQRLQGSLDKQLNVLTAYRPKLMKEVVDAFVALTIHFHERAGGSFRMSTSEGGETDLCDC